MTPVVDTCVLPTFDAVLASCCAFSCHSRADGRCSSSARRLGQSRKADAPQDDLRWTRYRPRRSHRKSPVTDRSRRPATSRSSPPWSEADEAITHCDNAAEAALSRAIANRAAGAHGVRPPRPARAEHPRSVIGPEGTRRIQRGKKSPEKPPNQASGPHRTVGQPTSSRHANGPFAVSG